MAGMFAPTGAGTGQALQNIASYLGQLEVQKRDLTSQEKRLREHLENQQKLQEMQSIQAITIQGMKAMELAAREGQSEEFLQGMAQQYNLPQSAIPYFKPGGLREVGYREYKGEGMVPSELWKEEALYGAALKPKPLSFEQQLQLKKAGRAEPKPKEYVPLNYENIIDETVNKLIAYRSADTLTPGENKEMLGLTDKLISVMPRWIAATFKRTGYKVTEQDYLGLFPPDIATLIRDQLKAGAPLGRYGLQKTGETGGTGKTGNPLGL